MIFAAHQQGLQQQVEELQQKLSEAGTQFISPEDIRRSRFYNRYELDLVEENESFKTLVDSIRASKGNVIPVLLRSKDESGYELVYGHRRWIASRIAGTAVLAYVRDDITDEMAAQLQLLENSERRAPSVLDRAFQVESHMASGAWTNQKALAEAVSMSEAYVSMLLQIAKVIPKTLQMAHPDHHKITYVQLKSLAQVAKSAPGELNKRIEIVRSNKAALSAEEATAILLRGDREKQASGSQRVEFTMTKNSVTLKARCLTTAKAAELESRIKELLKEMGLAADAA